MQSKFLVIETPDRTGEFEIDHIGGRYYVFALSKNIRGGKQTKRIGEVVSWEMAVDLARIFTGAPVLREKVTDL